MSPLKKLGALFALVALFAFSMTLTTPSLLAEKDRNSDAVLAAQNAIMGQASVMKLGHIRVNPAITRVGDWALIAAAIFPDATQKEEPKGSLILLAHRNPGGWRAALQGTAEFKYWLNAVPENLLSKQAKQNLFELGLPQEGQAAAAENGQAQLSLPYRTGNSWELTGGPHGTRRNSIDLANGYATLTAANSGTVSLPCANLVAITHSNGWQTSYYHMIKITVREGQHVSRGQSIGTAGSEIGCGGWSSGPHVHFSLEQNGYEVPMEGAYVGGYLVRASPGDYNGYMVRNGRNYPVGSYIYNDGTIGRGR